MMVAIAAAMVFAILAPAYVVQQNREEAVRILAAVEAQSANRLEQLIMVNTLTVSCLLAIPPEERDDDTFRECIDAGFEQAPDVPPPSIP
jgi:hypothetical protein